ncbi:MAG TPA: YihY/virulence factor BrkB family protein [Flavisolibacter sp.]|nr:YihY/virulence factor BrkB family protein [Flavisolibacter sp.]
MAIRSTIRKQFSRFARKQVYDGNRKLVLTNIGGYSFTTVAKAFLRQLKKTSLTERAAGISFNIVMAIPPTLVFIFTLIPYLPISKQFINQMFALIRDVVPGEKNNAAIITFLRDFLDKPRNGLLSFGLILAIIFSSNAMMGVLRSFDKNYPGFSKRKMLHKRKIALQITLICFFLIFLCILLLVAQSAVLKWLGVRGVGLRSILENVRWLFIILLTFYIVSHIYRHGPAVARKWPLITPGSLFATSLMIIATALVTYYVNHFSNYNKLYGSIGAIFILMSLIYANSLALLMGFELNVTLSQLHNSQTVSSNGSSKK